MAEGRPDWAAATRAAQAMKGSSPATRLPPAGRKHVVRDGQHNHLGDEQQDGSHHHQDVQEKLNDHTSRIQAIEAHIKNTSGVHEKHMDND